MRLGLLLTLLFLFFLHHAPAAAPPALSPVDRFLALYDRDGNFSLDRRECPEPMRRLFFRLDRNEDGKLDRSELLLVSDRLERFLAGKGPGPLGRPGARPGEVITPAAKGERQTDRLNVGDLAPDFTLPEVTGKRTVALSSFKGKRPVVLIFASYT